MLAPVAQAGPLAIIGNSLDGTVTVIDTAVSVTNTASPSNVTVTATIPLTSIPVAVIATNPVRAEAYIAALTNEGASLLTVFGTNPLAQIIEIPLGVFEPIGVAVNPAGNRAYVTGGLTDNVVSVVNLDTRAEIAMITLHPTHAVGPYGVVVHPSQPRLYVGNSNSGTISVINTTTNAIVTTITLTPCPNGCAPNKAAVSPDGTRLYVTDDFADVLWVINTVNNTIVTSVPLGTQSFPEGVAVHPDGSKVYVANLDVTGAGQVSQIDADTNTVTTSARVGVDPIGVAVDAAGTNVFVVNFGDDTVTAASTADLTSQVVLPVGGAPATFGQFITNDDNPGTVQFSSAAYTATEVAGAATIVVSRTGGLADGVTIAFATSAGTATPGDDYVQTSGVLTFAGGETSKTFTISLVKDNLVEPNETVNLTLSNPGGGATLGSPATAVLTIVSQDQAGIIEFSATTYSVGEAAGSAVIVVTRHDGTAAGATVSYATSDGTAKAPDDYATTTGTLTFGAGVSSLTFTIPIVNDTEGEGSETVNLTLSNAGGGATLGARKTAVLTIVDDESIVQFAAAEFLGLEGSPGGVITVTRTPLTGTVTVRYTTSDDTATAFRDYTSATGILTFPPGIGTKTFTVPIVDGSIFEVDEFVTITLSNPTGALLGNQKVARLRIRDNDPGTLKFSAATYSVPEKAPNGKLVVSVLRTGSLNATTTVLLETVDVTATGGATPVPGVNDYVSVSQTLVFLPGETKKDVAITIVDDKLAEGNETFKVRLSNPVNGTLSPSLLSEAIVTIVDDDKAGTVQFSGPTYVVTEPVSGTTTVDITVTRTGGDAGPATVTYATADGTATAGEDYVAAGGVLTFGVGDVKKTFTITVNADSVVEGTETVRLALSNPTGGLALGAQSTATLSILESQSVIQFSQLVYTVSEATPMATITVVRTGSLTSAARVAFRTVDGTATAPADYASRSGVLSFAANTGTATFTVPIVNDDLFESDETVTLVLSDPVGAALGQISTATLIITDNDPPGTIGFANATFSVTESTPTAKITITRTGGTATGITVQFATEDITATGGATATTPGADYVTSARTLTFAAKETTKTIDVPMVNDAIAEVPETVRLRLLNPTGGATLGLAEAILTITNDDKPGVIQFSAPTYTMSEGGAGATANVNIVVTRSGGTAPGVTVDYATSNGTATGGAGADPGVDYQTTAGTLSFGAGVTSLTFTVPVFGDADSEGDETVQLTLSNPTGGATLGTPSKAVLTILDDEQVIQFASATYTVGEAGPTAAITLVRSGSTASVATVKFDTGGATDTATAGSDYTAVSTTVTFPAKAATVTVPIPIINDTLVEGNETVTLTLSNPAVVVGGAAPVLGPRNVATLTIVDNDVAGVIRFGQPVFTVQETATGASVVAAITIVRIGTNLGSGVAVDFATQDGTATGAPATGAGVDYVTQSGTLTFAAGEAKKTVNITVFNDSLVEDNETVLLKLSNPTLGATLAPPVGAAAGVTSSDAVLAIVSDDRPGVFQFSAATFNASEALGAPTAATITVNRIGTPASLGAGVTVDYTFTGGTAIFGADYSLDRPGVAGGRLTFGAGVTSQTFNITILPDTGGEGPETIVLALQNPSAGATLGTPATATVTIADAQTSISFATNFMSTPESGLVKIPIVRTGPVAGVTSTATLIAVAGTATGGLDFTATPPGGVLVTFPPGSTTQTVTLPILPDTIPEGNEFIVLVLTNPSAGTALGPLPSAFLFITDDDPGTFRFSSPTFTVKEGEPVAVVSVTRADIPAGSLAQPTTVLVSTVNGTAKAGTDYTAVSNQVLTFGGGVTSQSFVIPIADDELKNGTRTFSVFLTPTAPGTSVSVGGTATVTILDND